MRIAGAALALSWLAPLAGCWFAAASAAADEQPSLWTESTRPTRPIQFHKIVVGVPVGDKIGKISGGLLCIGVRKVHYDGGNLSFNQAALSRVFHDQLTAAGYTVVGNPDTLFADGTRHAAELAVAGRVSSIYTKICYPRSRWGDFITAKGKATLTIDWEIYALLERRIVHRVRTDGHGEFGTSQGADEGMLLAEAFAQAARALAADGGFRHLATQQGPTTPPEVAVTPTTIAALPRFKASIVDQMVDVRLGVVTVFSGGGHGSGFFIDDAGHMLTNAHVVSGARRVRVKMSTGREIDGQVLSVDPVRDAALVKVNARGILGLPLRLDRVPIGSDVYAVGSPMEEDLDTTVSRGVLSAYRDRDGLAFIQSDVTVLPGNSGGPLLDANGNVIGMTVMGKLTDHGDPAGINFFAPIGDIVKHMRLQLRPVASQ